MLKAYSLYQRAILFEFEQEKIYHEVFGMSGFIKFLPRSVLIYNNYKRYLFIINYLIFVPVFVAWSICIHPLLLLILYLKWLPSVVKVSKLEPPLNVYLSLSDIKFFNYIDKSEENYPQKVVNFPFHKNQSKLPSALARINFLNYTNFGMLVKAFISSFITPFLLLFSKERYLMLFTYSSFYWYWTYFVLKDKKFNSIWLSNHYDRWLVLVDGLENVKQKILVQHGQLEYVKVESGDIFFPNFTNKLKNISKVYTIDNYSRGYFSEMIANELLIFKSIKSKLKVVDWPEKFIAKYKILVIGHQNDFAFHNALINYFETTYDIDIAYKTHPQQTTSFSLGRTWVVSDSNDLPKADFVISYGSSIDNEIKQLIPESVILNYGFDEKFEPVKAIQSVEHKLFDFLKN
jgi:hypothetical protein